MTNRTTVSSNVLTDQQYARFRDLMDERLGLHFPNKKRRDLERAIVSAYSQSSTRSLDEYYDLLSSASKDNKEMQRLVALATVGETYFYRDRRQIDILRTVILPQIIREKSATNRQLRIWSAGCATGEEAYTLAIVVKELIPLLDFWDVHILGTDINSKALKKAKAASYSSWSFRSNDGHALLEKYFEKHGRERRLREEIRNLVKIEYLNLNDGLYPSPFTDTENMDLIVFRNVAIYFSPETTRNVAAKLSACLREGGWLLTGASDPSLTGTAGLHLRDIGGCFIYQKSTESALKLKPVFALPDLNVTKSLRAQPTLSATPEPAIDTEAEAIAHISEEVTESPSDPLEEAAGLVDQGNVDAALSILRSNTDEGTHSARSCYMIAKIEADCGNLEEAKRWCALAIENNKLMIEAHFLMGMISQELGDYDEAIACLKKTIYINRTFAEAYVCLGSIYKRLGKEAQARKAFANASRILQDRHVDSLVTLPSSKAKLTDRVESGA